MHTQVTIRAVAALTFAAQGGCAFAVADKAAFKELQARPGVNFEVVDRSEKWADGYLTTRLRGVHVRDPRFREAVEEFTSSHLEVDDCWPPGHEAAGLPKDGFVALVDTSGARGSGRD